MFGEEEIDISSFKEKYKDGLNELKEALDKFPMGIEDVSVEEETNLRKKFLNFDLGIISFLKDKQRKEKGDSGVTVFLLQVFDSITLLKFPGKKKGEPEEDEEEPGSVYNYFS